VPGSRPARTDVDEGVDRIEQVAEQLGDDVEEGVDELAEDLGDDD
jgi:hypothetical protein